MNITGTTAEQNVDDMLESKTELLYKKLKSCNREIFYMSSAINAEVGSCYEVFHPEKKINMSYKMVKHITCTFDLPYIGFIRLE